MNRVVVGLLVFAIRLANAQGYVPGEILVKFRRPPTLRAVAWRIAQRLPAVGVDRVELPPGKSVPSALAEFRANPAVEYAEPNYILRTLDVDDPLFPQQWNLTKIWAPSGWGLCFGDPSITVAVLDTGVDLDHPDLAGQIAGSANFVGFGEAEDYNGHGTHTAGLVAAQTDNGIGIASLGYRTRLLIGKVANDRGYTTTALVAQGIAWADENGAKVITMSIGMPGGSQVLQDAVDQAWDDGLVLVAAAGNNNANRPTYPAAYEHCIAVAATDTNDRRCTFSNYGPWVDVAAPGLNIESTYIHQRYVTMSGTSMAAPQVAALAALLWAHGGRWNWRIRAVIQTSGDPTTGFGAFPVLRINARRALIRVP